VQIKTNIFNYNKNTTKLLSYPESLSALNLLKEESWEAIEFGVYFNLDTLNSNAIIFVFFLYYLTLTLSRVEREIFSQTRIISAGIKPTLKRLNIGNPGYNPGIRCTIVEVVQLFT